MRLILDGAIQKSNITMKREDQLRFCRVCLNQKFDPALGIVCNLTSRIADFEWACTDYIEGLEKQAKFSAKSKEHEMALITASLGKRFANYILDWIFLLFFKYVFGLTFGVFIAIIAPFRVSDF